MLDIIVFLLPSVLGLKIFKNLNKNKSIFDYVIYYLLFVLFTNLFVLIIFNGISEGMYNLTDMLDTNVLSYLFNSTIINIILPVVFTIINKYITFDIEVVNEKKVKKTKSSNRK